MKIINCIIKNSIILTDNRNDYLGNDYLDSFLIERNELTPLEFIEISKQLTEGEEDGKQSM